MMRLEAEDALFAGWVGRRDVAFVIIFVHEYSMRFYQCGCYSSRPGRDISSRIASLGLLLWWRIAFICSVIGISTP